MNAADRQQAEFECRLCGGGESHVLLDLGRQPLANDFIRSLDDKTDLQREPVVFVMCEECRLLQLRDLVPPKRMFETYLWTSSSSAAAHSYAEAFSKMLSDRYPPATHPSVVEVASNDGLLLKHLAAVGYRVLGVDPSNLADEATAAGIPTVRAFFAQDVAERIADDHGLADVVVARNVVGHVADLRGLLAGVQALLRPGGTFVVESPYALGLRHELQYDYIFHEHVSYFTMTTLADALVRYGLAPKRATFVSMNGGSFLCEAQRSEEPAADPSFAGLFELERVLDLNDPRGWDWFAAGVAQQREQLCAMLSVLASKGAVVGAYGAAARTMTMFNYCGLGPGLLRVIGDGSSRKQGLLCPGVHIPVVSPEQLLAIKPDYVLIGPWNFTQEIVGQLQGRGYTGKFIVPLPVPRFL